MKHLLLAATVVGLVGTIGTANADPVSVPLQASSLTIWSGATPGDPIDGTGFRQQGLPSASAAPGFGQAGGLPLVSTVGVTGASGPIDFNLPTGGTNTIQGFFNANPSGTFTSAGCPVASTCAGGELSDGTGNGHAPFLFATLFEFDFTAPSNGTLQVTHDDGVSLFLDSAGIPAPGACNTTTCPLDLFLPADAKPTNSSLTEVITLTGGVKYDLWYTSANGLPEILHTDFVPSPLIGHGLLVLLAVGGVLFGGKLVESRKTRHSHAA